MDYKNRIWNRRSVYLTKQSIEMIKNISYMLNETKVYAINVLIQEAYQIVKRKIENGEIV